MKPYCSLPEGPSLVLFPVFLSGVVMSNPTPPPVASPDKPVWRKPSDEEVRAAYEKIFDEQLKRSIFHGRI